MIAKGLLDKYGKPNENTPKEWLNSYIDYAATKVEGGKEQEQITVKNEEEENNKKVS